MDAHMTTTFPSFHQVLEACVLRFLGTRVMPLQAPIFPLNNDAVITSDAQYLAIVVTMQTNLWSTSFGYELLRLLISCTLINHFVFPCS
jgi:hypothetical protein